MGNSSEMLNTVENGVTGSIEPSSIEKAHIQQAMDASQTAIDAISTVVSVSTWALAIIGVAIAVIALWGWTTLRSAAREEAKQIANKRFDDYIKTDEFKEMVKVRIEKSVQEKWQNAIVVKLDEERKQPGDESPFPEGEQS